jgi:uncharacterized protein (DUF1800 family)
MTRILSYSSLTIRGALAMLLLLYATTGSRLIFPQAPSQPQPQTSLDPQDSPGSQSDISAKLKIPGHISSNQRSGQLQGDDRLLQVLNRFTYGPRPGDLDHLRAIGMQAWFNQQLNPQAIDDSALEQRLSQYPAVQLPLPQLMTRFPSQQVIRRFMDGKQDRPGGEGEKAIYADEIARYNERKVEGAKAAKVATAINGNVAMATSIPMLPNAPMLAPQATEQLSPSVALPFDPHTLSNRPVDQRFTALCKLTLPQLRTLREQLPAPDRALLVQGFTPPQLEAVAAFYGPAPVLDAELLQTKLLRDLYSERQLNEVMTDFWLNHFNVYLKKSQEAPYYIAAYERNAIRPRALGNFESLLFATAMSPAMLNYLDNASSVGPHSPFAQRANANQKRDLGLNENYARELMELQTVGVNGGYTQHDVTEVAKVFTGWTVGSPERGGLPIQAQFDPTKHEPGSKQVLGVTIKENGSKEGLEVLHLLATSPRTAQFISTKLAVRFVCDDPSPALVDRMAKTFLSTHGDLRRVLLAMVNSPEFFRSDTYRAKVKTPQDFVFSAVRASGAQVDSAAALVNVIGELGMPVYGMQTPNGYSMKADPWNNTASLVARLNFALALSSNRVAGVHTDWDAMLENPLRPASNSLPADSLSPPVNSLASLAPRALTPEVKEALLENELLHMPASPQTRQAILAQIDTAPAQQEASLRQIAVKDRRRDPFALIGVGVQPGKAVPLDPQAALAAGLLFGSPEFQRR